MAAQINPAELEAAQAQMEALQKGGKLPPGGNPLQLGGFPGGPGVPQVSVAGKPSAKEIAKKRNKRKLEKMARKKGRKK
jgi:hypothetical protein